MQQAMTEVKCEPPDEDDQLGELKSETLDLGVDTLTFTGNRTEQVPTSPSQEIVVKEEVEDCSAAEVENSQHYLNLEMYPICDSITGEVVIKPDNNNQYETQFENELPTTESFGLTEYYSANTEAESANFQPTEQMVPMLYSNYHFDEINDSVENEMQNENLIGIVNSDEPEYLGSECSDSMPQHMPLQVELSECWREDDNHSNKRKQPRKQNLKEVSNHTPVILQRIRPKPSPDPVNTPVTTHLIKCFECLESYYTITSLQNHLTAAHSKDWYICPFCLVEFHHLEIIKHLITNHKCKECGLEFVDKEYLTFHVKVDHLPIVRKAPAPRPKDESRISESCFECKMCEKRFPRRYLLRKHLGKCGTLSCSHCSQRFSSKLALDNHELKTHVNKNFKCTHGNCKASYKQEERLILHLQSQHRVVKRKR